MSYWPRRLAATGLSPGRGVGFARFGSLARGCQERKLLLSGFPRAKVFGWKSGPWMGKTGVSPVGNPPRMGKNQIHRNLLTIALTWGNPS